MEETQQTHTTTESRTLRAVSIALGLLLLAALGFFGAYALAGAWYTPAPAPQPAAAAAPDPFASVSLIAKSAYVLDLTTGKVLYQQNANAQLPLASLTKVALMLSVSQVLPPDTVIVIPPHTTPDGTPVQIPAGSEWRAQDLIDVTLVESSNEGAELLAGAAASAIQTKYPEASATPPADAPTLWRMNDLARELGLTNTYFLNVSGLDISTTQSGAYGSAHDVAELMAFAATSSLHTFVATTKTTVTRSTIEGKAITAINTDAALDSIPGILMGKTGYTDLAGGNLAVVFDAGNGHPVVAVVLGSTEDGRFSDMEQLVPAAQTAVVEGD